MKSIERLRRYQASSRRRRPSADSLFLIFKNLFIPPNLGGRYYRIPELIYEMITSDVERREQTEEQTPNAFSEDGILHLPVDESLPTEFCVQCGRKSVQVVTKPVRNPWNPISWYTRQESIEIGLCGKHVDDRRIGLALMYSLLLVGVIFLIFGAAILNLPMIALGIVASGFSGFFRARNVVYRTDGGGHCMKLKGVGSHFLKMYPNRGEVGDM